ncbi:MAG TPA: choice-of-anchor D domain-containing protein, partial [Acidimicrobiia bacterium]|nr:choice-of-anchor D domain-containing protein [Acidimicrobiia bacterium]
LPSGAIALSVGGSSMSSFIIVPTGDASDCQGKALGAGETCIAQVKYRPGVAGPESAVLHVDADPGGMPIVGLSGNSLAPGALEITAGDMLDFGDLAIQSMSTSKKITIHNKGGVACTNLAIAYNDPTDYKEVSKTCVTNLAPNASCDINVQFTPTAVGAHASSISISSDQGSVAPQVQGNGTSSVSVTKTGTGSVADKLATPIINCGSTCSGTYATTPITLHASTSNGIPFNNWGGACASAGANPDCTLSLTQPTFAVTATFGVCTPGTGMCTNGMASTCNSTGHWSTPTVCALGCYSDNTRCWDVDPLNGLAAALDAARGKASYVLTDGAQIDTTSGTVVDGNSTIVSIPSVVVQQAAGFPSIRVFEVGAIKMGKTTVVGTNALAIASDGDIEIDGGLHITSVIAGSGTITAPGRLGCDASSGAGATATSATRRAGGGGGSFAGLGGRGGNNPPTNGGAAGTMGTDLSLSPLRGGCDGGGTSLTFDSGDIGPGGGAVQLVSRTSIAIIAPGSINAGGGGALGRQTVGAIKPLGGSGGGSGGGILLEAPIVQVTGPSAAIAANGGGGSADCASADGQGGQPSSTAAVAGSCPGDATRTAGGSGQSTQLTADHGGDFSVGSDSNHAGGGGGGLGMIRVDTTTSTSGYVVSGGAYVSGGFSHQAVGKR